MLGIVKRLVGLLVVLLVALPFGGVLAMLDDDNQDDSIAALPVLEPCCPTLLANGRSAVPPEGKLTSPESDSSLPSRAPPRA